MGTSLAFHIVFAVIGMGLPLLLVIVEGLALRTGNDDYRRLAKMWSKALAITFGVGAVSGTVLSFELGLLWPEFMRYAGPIIGIPFSAEGFAFFIEAIFLGLYLYGWDRLSPLQHWLCSIPIAVSGLLSSVFVVCANAWMNTPTGFRMENGRPVDVQPFVAMFSPAWKTETIHTALGSYVFVGFAVASIYALAYLRGTRNSYMLRAMRVSLLMGAVAIPLQLVAGDAAARFDAENEPVKLASLESQFKTQPWAPLRIGGIPNDRTHHVTGAIEIPGMLSFLAFGSPSASVRGLDSWPARDKPDTLPVHLSFQAMVGSGSALLGLGAWFAVWAWRTRRRVTVAPPAILLRAITFGAPLALVAIEAGWMVTESGRQPWIVHGIMRTRDAVTTAPALDLAFYGFSFIYAMLGAATWWLLLRLGRMPEHHEERDDEGRLVVA